MPENGLSNTITYQNTPHSTSSLTALIAHHIMEGACLQIQCNPMGPHFSEHAVIIIQSASVSSSMAFVCNKINICIL